mmetsp:Transcript_57643/g.140797  ORF Transcript_57643/g.140797 Transcript_57643/m.140797 type:complete len:229 (+) Transcript_57643:112-798(+)
MTSNSNNTIEQVHSSLPYYLRPNDLQKQLNDLMDGLIPELKAASSEYAHTPMANGRWKLPSDVLDSSEGNKPCFIPTTTTTTATGKKWAGRRKDRQQRPPPEEKIIPDYIWMPKRKDLPAGYYHLRTQEAYIEINHLLKKCKPRRRTLCAYLFVHNEKEDAENREYNKLLQKLKELMFNRLVSDVPNDVHAARTKLLWMQSSGDARTRFGRAAYLPALTTSIVVGGGM